MKGIELGMHAVGLKFTDGLLLLRSTIDRSLAIAFGGSLDLLAQASC